MTKNAYAIKQLVQTRPAVLYLVGESTYEHVPQRLRRPAAARSAALDPSRRRGFTLLRETTDPEHPCTSEFETEIDGMPYELTTRIVVTPHFSYSSNFTPADPAQPERLEGAPAERPGMRRGVERPATDRLPAAESRSSTTRRS